MSRKHGPNPDNTPSKAFINRTSKRRKKNKAAKKARKENR
jgi:hypothetical protein